MEASLDFKEFHEVLPEIENKNDDEGKVFKLNQKEGNMINEVVPEKVDQELSTEYLNKGNTYSKLEKYDLAI